MPGYTIYETDTGKVLRVLKISVRDDPSLQLKSGESFILGTAAQFDIVVDGELVEEPGAREAHAANRQARQEASEARRAARLLQNTEFEADLQGVLQTGSPNERLMAEILLEIILQRIP